MYQFDELDKKQQEKIINKHRDINTPDDWSENTIWEFNENMVTKGFDIPKNKTYFDLFSQGSGASFEATVNLTNFLKAHNPAGDKFPRILDEWKKGNISYKVTQTGRYFHPYSMDVEIKHDIDQCEEIDEVEDVINSALEGGKDILDSASELSEWIKEKAREYAGNLHIQLEDEYSSLTSDESVIDAIKMNEMEFEMEED
jgi:hypothetical protein